MDGGHPLDAHADQAHAVAGGVEAADAGRRRRLDLAGRGPLSPTPIGITPVSCSMVDDVGLVERRHPRQEVAEVLGRPLGVAAEPIRGVGRSPSRPAPANQRGVVKWQ